MAKKKQLPKNQFILPMLLVIVPIVVLVTMGFGNYDAEEFRIISTTIIAEILVYVVYKALYLKSSGKS